MFRFPRACWRVKNRPKRVVLSIRRVREDPNRNAGNATERHSPALQPYPCRSLAATCLSGKRNLVLANSDFNVSSR